MFGAWEVVEVVRKNKGYHPRCRCECGTERVVDRHNLFSGKSTGCNTCAKKKSAAKRWLKYADALPDADHRCRLLNRLASQISRCHNERNRAYPHYGGRGIGVYKQWRDDRASFLKYVQLLDGWDDPSLQIDRIDVDGNYEPGNIRFVTAKQNANNKRLVLTLQQEVDELRERLRHCKCGAAS